MDEKESKATMRFRSTGLGTTMLDAEPESLAVVGDMLIIHVKTLAPVRWHIRGAVTYKGLVKIVWAALTNISVIKFVLFGFLRYKNPRLTDEF